MVITQLALGGLDVVVVLSTENLTIANSLPVVNPAIPDAPPFDFYFFCIYVFCRIICKTIINAPSFWGLSCKNIYPFGLHLLSFSVAYTCYISFLLQLCMLLLYWYC